MAERKPLRARVSGVKAFFEHEAAGGIVLLAAAMLGLILMNSPASQVYEALLETHVPIGLAPFALDKSLLHWINDGLMAIFFFLVGLEIKRELVVGELSTAKQAALPVIAAVGGMIVPAVIYAALNWGDPIALRGWAIPAATDIAFAVGVLALLGDRIPAPLKIFLLALAIIDDLGAIVIIALFYTASLSLVALGLAAVGIAALVLLNQRGVTAIWPYLLIGLLIWVCVMESGVHATLAGVATALAVPLAPAPGHSEGTLERLELAIGPWVRFFVLPLFAFANAGVSLSGITLAHVTSSIPMGIALGLLVGKATGIFAFSFVAIRMRLATPPEGATWAQIFGVAVLGGIGFTMSLFIGMLAFSDPAYAAPLRLGVLVGSLMSAVGGYLLLRFWVPGNDEGNEPRTDEQMSA